MNTPTLGADIDLSVPGTIQLTDRQNYDRVNLFPMPSSDPDDPLNWSRWRKTLNFTLVCFYVLWTFVQLDIGFTAWGPMMEQLQMTVDTLNNAAALNYAGLAVGCIFFIPFVHKYGRRPLYILSAALQLASCVWQARVKTNADILVSNLFSGLGGAISETIVQITIVDVFFVHQHATMNGWFLGFSTIGAFLGPVASGYVTNSQGWRWMWWWCVIFLAVTLLAIVFFYEESKYIPVVVGSHVTAATHAQISSVGDPESSFSQKADNDTKTPGLEHVASQTSPAPQYGRKPYAQRMALVTKTPGSLAPYFWQPIAVLFSFPAVAYTALTYGSILAWFAIMTSVQATFLILPPYNFTSIGIGLMNLPPFVGAFFGFFYGGWLNDKSIVLLAKRNQGVYEPEMRLWLAIPCAIVIPGGILIFGLGLAHELHWIVLAVGYAVFGFGFFAVGDISLSYCTDCYQDIIGDAIIGVVFVRNVFSVIVLFTITPWLSGMGIQNLHILTASLAFAILSLPVLFLKYGKRFRRTTTDRYRKYARKQPTHRVM